MKKHILLPLLALAGGGVGLALHIWELTSAWDGEICVFLPGHPSTLALVGLTVVMACAVAVLNRGGEPPARWQDSMYCPSSAYMTVMVMGAILLMVSAGLGMMEVWDRFLLWTMDSKRHMLPLMEGLTSLSSIPAALGMVFLGRGAYRGTLKAEDRWFTALPAYTAAFWVIAVYQDNAISPFPNLFAYPLLSSVCLLLALYYGCAAAYGRVRPRAASCVALLGIYFTLVSMAGASRLEIIRRAAFLLLVAGQLSPLLRARFGPAWPHRLAGDMGESTETESDENPGARNQAGDAGMEGM